VLPVPTLDYLAQFTGRDASTYSAFAEQALEQATLMFSTVTKLTDLPADPDQQQLAINGILQMAERLYLEQPYAAIKASPFNSEEIGSYSYNKGYNSSVSLKGAVAGELTGLFWWDLAVEELSQVSRSLVGGGSIGVFQHEVRREAPTGRPMVIGPADVALPDFGQLGGFDYLEPPDPGVIVVDPDTEDPANPSLGG
jgi:hypothetical protein